MRQFFQNGNPRGTSSRFNSPRRFPMRPQGEVGSRRCKIDISKSPKSGGAVIRTGPDGIREKKRIDRIEKAGQFVRASLLSPLPWGERVRVWGTRTYRGPLLF